LRQEIAIPDHVQIIGAIAMGYPHESNGYPHNDHEEKGVSASRDRHGVNDIIHRGKW
jgi:hypothetical protein